MHVVGHAVETEAIAADLKRDVRMFGFSNGGPDRFVRPGFGRLGPIGAVKATAGGVFAFGFGRQADAEAGLFREPLAPGNGLVPRDANDRGIGDAELLLRPEGRRRGGGVFDERGVLGVADRAQGGAEGSDRDLVRGALVAAAVVGAHGEGAAGQGAHWRSDERLSGRHGSMVSPGLTEIRLTAFDSELKEGGNPWDCWTDARH